MFWGGMGVNLRYISEWIINLRLTRIDIFL